MSSASHTRTDNPGPTAFAVVRRGLDLLTQLCILIAGISLVFIVISFGWMVYGRYVLNDTPTWIGQLALLLIIYVVCLGTAAGVHRHTHLSIDFVRNSFPPVIRETLHFISELMVTAFGVIMAWQGWVLTVSNAGHRLAMLNINASWKAMPLVWCGALIVIFTVFNFIDRTVIQKKGTD